MALSKTTNLSPCPDAIAIGSQEPPIANETIPHIFSSGRLLCIPGRRTLSPRETPGGITSASFPSCIIVAHHDAFSQRHLGRRTVTRGAYSKAGDKALLPRIHGLVDKRAL